MRVFLLLALLLALTPARAQTTDTRWGEVITIAQAPQTDAPALLLDRGRIYAAWQASDDAGFRHGLTLLGEGVAPQTSVLDLLHVVPHTRTLAVAGGGDLHLLWIDAPYGEESAGMRLWSMGLTPALARSRWPLRLAETRVDAYATLPEPGGALRVIYSGGLRAEPDLFTVYLDALGRPRTPERIARDVRWPQLLRDSAGTAHVFYQRASDRTLMHGILDEDTMSEPVALTTTPRLDPADRLLDVRAGVDATHGYVFWNLARADGTAQTWVAAGPLDGESWSAPRLLEGVTRVSPLDEPGDSLLAAAQSGEALAVLTFADGALANTDAVIPLDSPLIGQPGLYRDFDGTLVLTWAEPRDSAAADLKLVIGQPGD